MRIRVIIVLGVLLSLLIPQISLTHAQGTCSLSPRLIPNMPGRVRAVGIGGNNLRASAGLTAEIAGQLANNTEFIVQSGPECVDSLNWYEIETLDGISGWTAEGDEGLYWLEPAPFCTEQQRAADIHYTLDQQTEAVFGKLIDARYIPEHNSILIGSEPANWQGLANFPPHAVLLDYHLFNLETRTLTPVEYPFADIVTSELTDKLGISEDIFGEHSHMLYSLHVSPQRDRILYFIDNPPIEDCAHGCYTTQVWLADVDGSNATEVGRLIMGDAGYIDWTWGSNGRIYLTMIYGDMSYGIVEICDDGSCFNRPEEGFPFFYSFPSVSPNGEYLTVVDLGQQTNFFGNFRLLEFSSDTWIDLPLAGWFRPAVWSQDGQTIYAITWVDDGLKLAATRLDDLDHAELLVDEIHAGNLSQWGIAEEFELMFIGETYFGINIYCMRQFES